MVVEQNAIHKQTSEANSKFTGVNSIKNYFASVPGYPMHGRYVLLSGHQKNNTPTEAKLKSVEVI